MARTKTETTEAKRMLTYTEVGEALGVSSSTISRMVTSGELGSVRSGRRSVRVPTEALEEFVRQGGIPVGGTRKGRTS